MSRDNSTAVTDKTMVTNLGVGFSMGLGANIVETLDKYFLSQGCGGFRTIALSIPGVLFCSDENVFAINPDFVSGFRVSGQALFNSARPQVEPGTVPRALDLIAVENSLVEGSFLMSADISDSEVFSVDIC